MGKTLVRTSRRKYKKSAKGGKRTKRGRRVMKKSGRMRMHSHSRSHKRYTRTRRHMRGGVVLGWMQDNCINGIVGMDRLKEYIRTQWNEFRYKKYKKLIGDFNDNDVEKLRNDFKVELAERQGDRVRYGNYLHTDPLSPFICQDWNQLKVGLNELKSNKDCSSVALYYLTILDILYANQLIKEPPVVPPPPSSSRPDYVPTSQDFNMSLRYGTLAREQEAAANQVAANLNADAP
jgi:hypothetical protein